jgi:hypothetical protein
MGYFKRKRTNKKKGKRGTKRYRGGTNQPEAVQTVVETKKEVVSEEQINQAKEPVRTALEELLSAHQNGEDTVSKKADFESKVEAFINTLNPSQNRSEM